MKKSFVLLSGGMDSATLLARTIGLGLSESENVVAVRFSYGSKHNDYEAPMAEKLADYYRVPFIQKDLTEAMMAGSRSSLTGPPKIPEGHYTDPIMESTVVPGRNFLFISAMINIAWEVDGGGDILIGAHKGDAAIYPDCRQEFIRSMRNAIRIGTEERCWLYAPFISMDKNQILERGLELNVPYKFTRTCYKKQEKACGKCGACVERKEAFAKQGVQDPIEYEE